MTDYELPEDPFEELRKTQILEGQSIQALENEAKQHRAERIALQKQHVQEKQNELDSLLKQAKEQHSALKKEYKTVTKQKRYDLDKLIKEARTKQDDIIRTRKKELAQKRKAIADLQRNAKTKIKNLPYAERQKLQDQLAKLMRNVLDEQQEMEYKERQVTKYEQSELVRLFSDSKDQFKALQHEQLSRIKESLSDILSHIRVHKKTIRDELEALVKTERDKLDAFLKNVHVNYKALRQKHSDAIAEHSRFVHDLMRQCRELIKNGDLEEAKKVQHKAQQRIQELHSMLKREHRDLVKDTTFNLAQLEQDASQSQRVMEKRHVALLESTKQELHAQSKAHFEQAEEELVEQTRNDLHTLEDEMLTRHKDLHLEQLEMVKRMSVKMENQTADHQRRIRQEQLDVVNLAKQGLASAEKEMRTDHDKAKKMHGDMLEHTRNTISDFHKDKGKEYQTLYQEQLKTFSKERFSPSPQNRSDGSVERHTRGESDLVQRKEISAEKARLKDQRSRISQHAKEKMIEAGRYLQQREQDIHAEMRRIARAENDQSKALREDMDLAIKASEKAHKQRLDAAETELNDAIKAMEQQKSSTLTQIRKIHTALDQADGDAKASLETTLQQAEKTHRELVEEQAKSLRSIRTNVEAKQQASMDLCREEKADLLQRHTQSIQALQLSLDKRRTKLEEEMQSLSTEHQHIAQSVMLDAEQKQKNLKQPNTDS